MSSPNKGKAPEAKSNKTIGDAEFIPYPVVIDLLNVAWDAAPHDLAMWIFLGPGIEGLTAYSRNGDPPEFELFRFPVYFRNADYRSFLMHTWFDRAEIGNFKPTDRYLTGIQLIDRWSNRPNIDAEGFIAAKIRELRLQDMHPLAGITQWTERDKDFWPHKNDALFSLSAIESVEQADFADSLENESGDRKRERPVSARELRNAFRKFPDPAKNEKWWNDRLDDAKNYLLTEYRAKPGTPGQTDSALWYPSQIAGWLIEKNHLPKTVVVQSLRKNFPDCNDAADLLENI